MYLRNSSVLGDPYESGNPKALLTKSLFQVTKDIAVALRERKRERVFEMVARGSAGSKRDITSQYSSIKITKRGIQEH